MVRAEIMEAIAAETPLAYVEHLRREVTYPPGGERVVAVEFGRRRGSVHCRFEDGHVGVVGSSALVATWEKYSEVRAGLDAAAAQQREAREALNARISRVTEKLGGGAKMALAPYSEGGRSRAQMTAGVWMPIDLAERVVDGLANLGGEPQSPADREQIADDLNRLWEILRRIPGNQPGGGEGFADLVLEAARFIRPPAGDTAA